MINGTKTVFFGRLLPVIITFISLPAGISKMNLKLFTIYTLIGSSIWTLLLAIISVNLGQNGNSLTNFFEVLDMGIVITIVIFILYSIYKYKKKLN